MTPQIIAHRGASYLAPENTLTAFKKAMEIGADGVEMDVQQTIDAGLVIHHDYMIDLHTDISGKIYDMTMGDLKELDFGSWKDAIYQDEKIATLQEAMELCKQMPECTVPVSFNLWLFLLLNVGTLLASIAMLLGPSYLITRIHPANSMRYE